MRRRNAIGSLDVDRLAGDQHFARGRHLEPVEQAQERRLAAAALADQHHRLAALDGEAGVVERAHSVPSATRPLETR